MEFAIVLMVGKAISASINLALMIAMEMGNVQN
jgi:hypothetical protein